MVADPEKRIVDYMNSAVLPNILRRAAEGAEQGAVGCGAGIVAVRHGAVAAVAELTTVLETHVSPENQNAVRNLVPGLEKSRAYRGRGGEVIREVACQLLERVAAAAFWPFKDATGVRYLQTLNDCLRHSTMSIQVAAVDALHKLSHLRFSETLGCECVDAYVASLGKADEHIAARRGYVLALGALPPAVQRARCGEVLGVLCREARGDVLPGGQDQDDPQTRQFAVVSLGRACAAAGAAVGDELVEEVVRTLDAALRDYAVDRRGDVGSWVREAAMEVVAVLLDLQRRGAPPRLKAGTATHFVSLVLQQAVEKIDRVRDNAVRLLRYLLASCDSRGPALSPDAVYSRVCRGEAMSLPTEAVTAYVAAATADASDAWPPAHSEVLAAALRAASPEDEAAGARAEVSVFQALAPLLDLQEYRPLMVAGLVISVGGISEHSRGTRGRPSWAASGVRAGRRRRSAAISSRSSARSPRLTRTRRPRG